MPYSRAVLLGRPERRLGLVESPWQRAPASLWEGPPGLKGATLGGTWSRAV
jgi:hypothetical protein